jgi:hypothetical protein
MIKKELLQENANLMKEDILLLMEEKRLLYLKKYLLKNIIINIDYCCIRKND